MRKSTGALVVLALMLCVTPVVYSKCFRNQNRCCHQVVYHRCHCRAHIQYQEKVRKINEKYQKALRKAEEDLNRNCGGYRVDNHSNYYHFKFEASGVDYGKKKFRIICENGKCYREEIKDEEPKAEKAE